jgi:ribosomal protein S18 acetylase RimI-like enzyme
MTVSVPIRPMTHDDVDALVQLSLLAWAPVFASFRRVIRPEVYALLYPDWERQQRAVVEQACRDGGRVRVWVAEWDGVVAGYIACTLNRETRAGAVELLAVHPDYQNRGIGTSLNTFALEQMRASGLRLAELMTGGDPGHAPARRSYEKAGYTALPIVARHGPFE